MVPKQTEFTKDKPTVQYSDLMIWAILTGKLELAKVCSQQARKNKRFFFAYKEYKSKNYDEDILCSKVRCWHRLVITDLGDTRQMTYEIHSPFPF